MVCKIKVDSESVTSVNSLSDANSKFPKIPRQNQKTPQKQLRQSNCDKSQW